MVENSPAGSDPTPESSPDGTAPGSRSRRDVLIGTLAAGGLAGCLGGDSGGGQSSPTPAPADTPSSSLKTADTTDAGDAEFEVGETSYTVSSRGNLTSDSDQYGAIYADDAFASGQSVEVTVESQEETDGWIRTGIMVANDITAAGGAGDLSMAISPNGGPELWRTADDGFWGGGHYTRASESVELPVRFRVDREGTTFTGYYSTDGGENYTEVGSYDIPEAAEAQDVGMFTISRSSERSTAEFSDFRVGSAPTPTPTPTPVEPSQEAHPLPDDAEALDRVVFGSEPSESNHDLAPESSMIDEGLQDSKARRIQFPDVDHEKPIGSMSFTMECDPAERTYLTVKLEQNPDIVEGGPPFPIFLFDGDEQVGYRIHREDWTSLGGLLQRGSGPYQGRQVHAAKGDYVYVSTMLPDSMTESETVDIRLATWGGDKGPRGPTNPIYRAYTHTDPLFSLPSDEEHTLNRDIGEPAGPGEDPLATLKAKTEAMVQHGQSQDRLSPRGAKGLAVAYPRDWIDTLDRDAAFETIRNTLDHWTRRLAAEDTEPGDIFVDLGPQDGDLAHAYVLMAGEFNDRGVLEAELPEHPAGSITRREAYADFFVEAYQWRQQLGKWITNQVMIVRADGLVFEGYALQDLDPERAPPQSKIDTWFNQGIGTEPLRKLEGEGEAHDGHGGWELQSETFHILSEAGLNREPRFSSGYGGHPAGTLSKLAESLERMGKDAAAAKARERLADNIEAMGWFRWQGQEPLPDSNERLSMQAAVLGARGSQWPGHTGSWQGYGGWAAGHAKILGEDNEVAKRWAELQLEHGRHDFWELEETGYNKYPDSRIALVHRIIYQYEGVRALQDMEPSSYQLPWEREQDFFADPDQGMVSIADGDRQIQISLGHSNGTHISNTVKFDVEGPNSHRIGLTELRRKEFPLERTVERPNALHTSSSEGRYRGPYYFGWKDEEHGLDQALRGEEIPYAARANGQPWPGTANPMTQSRPHVFAGFGYHYREARVGPYLIGMNSTGAKERGFGPAQTFEMDVPGDSVVDVATGEEVTADTVTVAARETRVLKVGSW